VSAEAEDSPLVEAVTRKRLVKTQQVESTSYNIVLNLFNDAISNTENIEYEIPR
jgi:hypothetical protein